MHRASSIIHGPELSIRCDRVQTISQSVLIPGRVRPRTGCNIDRLNHSETSIDVIYGGHGSICSRLEKHSPEVNPIFVALSCTKFGIVRS